MEYNFTNFFTSLGMKCVQELKSLMRVQKGVDGGQYAKLDTKTVWNKLRTNSKTPEKRMIDTADFLNRGFQTTADANSTTVFISQAMHGIKLRSMTKTLDKYRAKGGSKFISQSVKVSKASKNAIPFSELASYQNESGKSLFFPVTTQQINNLQSVQKAIPQFKNEVINQTKAMFPELLKTKTVRI